MKQFISNLFSRVAAVAAVALLTAATAWGADQTVTLTQSVLGLSGSYTSNTEKTIDGITYVYTDLMKNNDNIQAKASSGVIYNKTAYTGKIKSVAITHSGTARATTILGSSDGTEWTQIATGSGSITGDFSSGSYNYFKITRGANAAYWTKIEITYEPGNTPPSISADNVDIAYNATTGSIAYSIDNSVEGGVVSAAVTGGDWLTLGNGTASPISFTCSANAGIDSRTATVTLTYTYNTNRTVTKAVTVTQAANPNAVNSISDITATGDYIVRGTIVAKSQRGFIVGDGTGYVYYYNQNYTQSDYNVGDKVKMSGAVSTYGGVFQFTSNATITSASESGYAVEDPTVLTGADMDSRVASTTPAQLSSFVQYEGILSVSGSYYNITSIDGATTAKGSISYPINTGFTSLFGKKVRVTGYYVGISSSQYYNTMIGSIEEIAVPAINATNSVELEFDAISGEIEYSIGNPVSGVTLAATTTADWISNINVTSNKVTFSTTANDGTADRSATITLTYTGADNKNVTVTQKHYVAEFAELPFEFDGGKEALANTGGMSQNGLGGDYGSSPKLKFDSTGDWVFSPP